MTATDSESRRIEMASAALAPFRLSRAEVTVLAGLLHQAKLRKAVRFSTPQNAPTALPPLPGSAATS